jgi:ribose transport system permease protein
MQLIVAGAMFTLGAVTIDGFATKPSVMAMLVAASLLGLAAAGQTVLVLVGAIDFSIPAVIALGAIVISELTGAHGWAFLPAFGVIAVIAAVIGAINGFVSQRFDAHPLVVTIGMSSIVTGALLAWTKSAPAGTAPAFLGKLTSAGGSTFGVGVPPIVVIWAAIAVVVGLVLRRTVAGRHLYATGSNPRAADLALVRTRQIWVGAFVLSALCAAVVGVLLAGYAGSGTTEIGTPYLFEGLTAVIVGGSAYGARGDYWRTVLGALTLTFLTTVMIGKGYSNADQEIVFGLLILVIVAGYGREPRLRDRM